MAPVEAPIGRLTRCQGLAWTLCCRHGGALTVALLAMLAFLRGADGWRRGLYLVPDFAAYTAGGLGLYPSPLGRALGAAGSEGFALVSAVGFAGVVVAVSIAANRAGRSGVFAAVLASVLAGSLYLAYAGIEAPSLALLLLGLGGVAPWLFVPIAAGMHLSLAPFALLVLPRSTAAGRAALILLGMVVTAALVFTPYRGIVAEASLRAGLWGVVLGVFAAFPAWLVCKFDRTVGFAALVGASECVATGAPDARYFLPAALLLCSRSERFA